MSEAAIDGKASNTLAMERHMIFICPECGHAVDTQHEWRQHLNTVHNYARKRAQDFDFKEIDSKYHECQICLKRLAHAHHSPVLLQYHRFSHLSFGGPFRCRYCSGAYVKKRALSVHLFRCHSQLMNKVDNEYKMDKMRQAIALRHPRFNREFFMRFICPQCGKLFQRFRDWLDHIDQAHLSTSEKLCMHRIVSSRDYYCDQCSYTMKNGPSWDQLRRHHFSHLTHDSYFQCAFCNTQKSFKTDLFLHFIKYHRLDYLKNKKYICAPEEWAGPAKEIILKQIDIYSQNGGADDPNTAKDFCNDNETDVVRKLADIMQKELTGSIERDSVKRKQFRIQGEANRASKVRDILSPEKLTKVERQPNTKQDKDILQKALRDSCINLEEEVCTSESQIQTMQPNCNGYESVFVVEMGHEKNNGHAVEAMNCIELNDYELEEICEEMFEEIPNQAEAELRHDSTNSTNDSLKREIYKHINYLCPECLREFDNQPDWRAHVFDEHNLTNAVKLKFRPLNAQKSAFLCLACYQVQRTSKHVDLQRHYFQHMPHQCYLKCTICKKTKSSKPKMLQHLEFVHRIYIQKDIVPKVTTSNAMKSQCLECDMTYNTLQLQNHLRVCPARLAPLNVTQYNNIAKNMKLIEHLRKANQRIDEMLLEAGIQVSS